MDNTQGRGHGNSYHNKGWKSDVSPVNTSVLQSRINKSTLLDRQLIFQSRREKECAKKNHTPCKKYHSSNAASEAVKYSSSTKSVHRQFM